ncbi:hypothetical protein K493DRAFT_315868 [Basidiobolus meristosporus CBS 931.73]|uniref:Secreted protein n=1 Tax=Basidiobolus meristosporus CBS 931.73 TaxID=1314790 RepID=A0A1Y1Y6S5_9FUNG|nr:hypothetical protein K493DRAFT_315868 [Basidiobolus meristosporus CBS 931.73]|eukprot:ORX93688.1 hypothetical protein K493DRAFT_315868 [Basidiobolus meristosporus CBS 931.73]
MTLSINNLLFVLSSALLASGYVVERGYTPPVGLNYCQDLVSHLNTRYKAELPLEKCLNIPDSSAGETELPDPSSLGCHELLKGLRERDVLVDEHVCSVDKNDVGTLDEVKGKYKDRCEDIIQRLQQYTHKPLVSVCVSVALDPVKPLLGGTHAPEDDLSQYDCNGLIRQLNILGVRIDRNVCEKRTKARREFRKRADPTNKAPGTANKCDLVKQALTAEGFSPQTWRCVGESDSFDASKATGRGDQGLCNSMKSKLEKHQVPIKRVACMDKPVVFT